MKRITKKRLTEFIERNAYVGPTTGVGLGDAPDSYLSRIDNSYITFVGLENDLKFLLKRGITEQLQSGFDSKSVTNIGFNPTEEKWYGWSHRAIYGFGVGSECKMGHAGFKASNKEEFGKACLSFWGDSEYSIGDDKYEFTTGEGYNGEKDVDGVLITYTYNDKVPNKRLRGTTYKNFTPFPTKWGKGEWTAKTLEEAKQMAIDFANSVS